MSQTTEDKIVNHFSANCYLLPYLDSMLIDSNIYRLSNKISFLL